MVGGAWLRWVVLVIAVLDPAGAATAAELLPMRGSVYITLPDTTMGSSTASKRRYLLHVPHPATAAPRPLLIVLHGFGGNPVQMEAVTGFSALAATAGFIAAYPLGRGQPPQWPIAAAAPEAAAEVAFIRAMLADIAARTALDQRRVYVTGLSNGAQMAWRLGCLLPESIAAIALVAGNYPPYPDCPLPTLPLPALVMHGTADTVLPYDGRVVQFSPLFWATQRAKQNGCGTTPELMQQTPHLLVQNWPDCPPQTAVRFYTVFGQGHVWPEHPAATPLIWDFLQSYTKEPMN
jgi:polyhydroxybutyrate depolymerase